MQTPIPVEIFFKNAVFPVVLTRPDRVSYSSLVLADLSFQDLLDKEKQAPFLHAEEQIYLAGLPTPARQWSYLLGRYAAKTALIHYLDTYKQHPKAHQICVEAGVFSQPIVRNAALPGLQVSLAHADNLAVALAFDESQPMGIDVEKVDTSNARLVSEILTDQEKLLVISKWPFLQDLAHAWIWTAKEALSKVLKTGLTVSLSLYEVEDITLQNGLIVATYKHFLQYKSISFFWQASFVSIALPRETQLHIDFDLPQNR